MNFNKLSQQLTREIKRSPAKAATLGSLLLVALWFWFPLIQGWLGSTQTRAQPARPANVPVVIATEAPTATVSAAAGALDWREIAEGLASDRWMLPGELRSATFDPFFPELPQPVEVAEEETLAEKIASVDVAPQDAGLEITSVIVGQGTALARINNQNYRLGDVISAQAAMAEYKVASIESWGAVLQSQGRSYKLLLNENPVRNMNRLILRNGDLLTSAPAEGTAPSPPEQGRTGNLQPPPLESSGIHP